MKALTLWQPWASLVRDERKIIETRSWKTSHHDPIAIHAGKKIDKDTCIKFGYDPKTIETGVVLCIVQVLDCIQLPNANVLPDEYGNFEDGRFAWILEMIKILDNPIPCKGHQMLWNWDAPDKLIEEIFS